MNTNKKYNLLSLDPMYSSLHERIASLIAKEKYAITSCLSMKVYLPTFKVQLIKKIISRCQHLPDDDLINRIRNINSYHHAYVKKKETRELTNNELIYMAKYYLALKQFVHEKAINLLLIHNDTRWYHAVGIMLCNDLGIKYLVTEQGLIRPYTTVIDTHGVNFSAKLPEKQLDKTQVNYRPKHTHDSPLSMFMFAVFLFFFKLESIFQTKARYLHNNYSFTKYVRRLINKLKNKKNVVSFPTKEKQTLLLLLQLELDSQLLMYSDIDHNQHLINQIEQECAKAGFALIIKKHPLDLLHYNVSPNTKFVSGSVKDLASNVDAAITVNSSAALEVMKTNTPLYLLGESIYARDGVAKRISIGDIHTELKNERGRSLVDNRKQFLSIIEKEYLIKGAGYSYRDDILYEKIYSLIVNQE